MASVSEAGADDAGGPFEDGAVSGDVMALLREFRIDFDGLSENTPNLPFPLSFSLITFACAVSFSFPLPCPLTVALLPTGFPTPSDNPPNSSTALASA